MTPEREITLRRLAEHKRQAGSFAWAEELIRNGLDPDRWSCEQPVRRSMRTSGRRASPLDAQTFDPADNSLDVVWSTGAAVLRSDFDGAYSEVLDMTPGAVRLGRLNAGAPFLDTHDSSGLTAVLGSVVPASARVAGGIGTCRVLLSRSPSNASKVQDIIEGVIRNVSVGYTVHAYAWSDPRDGGPLVFRVTDWEPLEISAVPVPADAGAQIRAVFG